METSEAHAGTRKIIMRGHLPKRINQKIPAFLEIAESFNEDS
jgi:hypothetical protein